MSTSNIELEKNRREREDLEKELKWVENVAPIFETKRKILFLKSLSNTHSTNVHEIVVSSGSVPCNTTSKTITFYVPPSSSLKGDTNARKDSWVSTGNTSYSCSNAKGGPQRRPTQLEGYRQLYFDGILGYPNVISQEIRKKMNKFSTNNVITYEDHLRSFLDMINNNEIEHDDVEMNFFV